jgi:molybdenum cofactor cytidylyltransferase
MGSSLGLAMDWLLARTSIPDAVLLLVCDQPHVSAELMRKLIVKQTTGESPIVASRYIRSSDGRGGDNPSVGVPAVFGSAFYPELAAVRGDRGARHILTLHASETSYVDFPQGSFDVDTPADQLLMMRRART